MIAVKAIFGDDVRRFSIDPALKFAGLKEEVKTRFGISADNLMMKFKDDEGELCRITGDDEFDEAAVIAAELKPAILRVHVEVTVDGEREKAGENDELGQSVRQLLDALGIPVDDAVRFLSSIDVEDAKKFKAMLPMMFAGHGFPRGFPKDGGSETAEQPNEPSNGPAIHDGVECDGCQMYPIRGIRYKSTTKDDFDLCESCVKKSPYTEDQYTVIQQPRDGWQGGSRGPCGFMRGMMRGPWHKFGPHASHVPAPGPIDDASMLPDAPLHPGTRGPAVASLQQALIQLGHLHPGAVRYARGLYGPRTTQAIAALQHAGGETPTGIFDTAVRAKLAEQLHSPPAKAGPTESGAPPAASGPSCRMGPWKEEHERKWHGGCRRGGAGLLSSRFVSDKSLPDGAKVQPGHKFTKTWTLRNDGPTAWPETAALVFVKGDRLHEDDVKLVGAVEPGAEVDVSVEMIAPEPTGRYVSFWRVSAVGEAERRRNRPPLIGGFGQRVWLQIVVDGEACEVVDSENEMDAENGLESCHPAGKPFEQWGVAELKAELAAHGADCSGCVEKDDLVQLLRATLNSQPRNTDEQPAPPVDATTAQVEEGIKAACDAFGVPSAGAASLVQAVQPFLQMAAQQRQQQQQPPLPFDVGALAQLAQPFVQNLATAAQQQQPQQLQGPPNPDLSMLMQNVMPFLSMAQNVAQQPTAGQPTAHAADTQMEVPKPETPKPETPKPKTVEPETVEAKPAEPKPVEPETTEPQTQDPGTPEPETLQIPDGTKQKLVQLHDMGFLDDAENLAALDRAEGRVELALDILFKAM